jgi:predicted PurR-regulated permease PerM
VSSTPLDKESAVGDPAGPAPELRRTPNVPPAAPPASPTAVILTLVATVAALYLGRDVFIPLALAILLSFALGPPVRWLHRRGVPRVPAVLAVMLVVTLFIGGFATLVANQLSHLAQGLPRYEANLRVKIQELGGAMPGGGVIDRTAELLRGLGRDLQKITEDAAEAPGPIPPSSPAEEPPKPIPVEIHEPPPAPVEALSTYVGPLLQPIATAGIVLVFIVFVLLQREDLRDRMIRLFGQHDVHRTTEAVNDAAKRIGRYLLMQLVINVCYGVPVGIGLFLIGVPNALLWGVLATVLRFIPYLGPILAATFPIALSFAVDPGWTTPLLVVALFVTLELFSNNVMEPWLYGSSTGLSPLAVIVAAVFWTTLWGPIGLLLSTPLTVCLVVLGRHVPQLQFFEVLLGDEPVLDPEVKFYQRVLAGDPHEAEELAADLIEEQSLARVFDGVVLPALVFADQDRLRGAFDHARARELAETFIGIIDGLAEAAEGEEKKPGPNPGEEHPPRVRALCVGARGGFDVAAATMLGHLLRRQGAPAEVADAGALLRTPGRVGGFDVVCLSYVDPEASRQARRLIARLRARQAAPTTLCLGLWGLRPDRAEEARAATRADVVAGSLDEAARRILDRKPAVRETPPEEATAAVAG